MLGRIVVRDTCTVSISLVEDSNCVLGLLEGSSPQRTSQPRCEAALLHLLELGMCDCLQLSDGWAHH